MKSALFSRIMMPLAAVCLLAVGCSKIKHAQNYTTTNVETPPSAGKGGDAIIKLSVNHDNITIDSGTVYIKYNSPVVPKNANYDDSMLIMDIKGAEMVMFEDLKPGDYYIFCRGWDIIRSEKVKGGLPFTILEKNAHTTHQFILPVNTYE